MRAKQHRQAGSASAIERSRTVLLLSRDTVAAALLGGLVETLGYQVRFARPPESAEDSLRRVRPRICLVDCVDPDACSQEFVGRATMRGIAVVVFGTREALDRVRALAAEHRLETLLVPAGVDELQAVLDRVVQG
jgi:DNA-binding NtrC family response regulator